jgi:hypothetical protein
MLKARLSVSISAIDSFACREGKLYGEESGKLYEWFRMLNTLGWTYSRFDMVLAAQAKSATESIGKYLRF